MFILLAPLAVAGIAVGMAVDLIAHAIADSPPFKEARRRDSERMWADRDKNSSMYPRDGG